jgi:hypothetical protein
MRIKNKMIKGGSSPLSILGVVLIIVLGALPLCGQADPVPTNGLPE